MPSIVHIKKNYKMIYNNTLILMKNVQKLNCMADPIRGSIYFELQKYIKKVTYL